MQYDDGDNELLDLSQETVDWRPLTEASPQPPPAPPTENGPAAATASAPAKDAPSSVPVICNDKRGVFDVRGLCILMDGGKTVSATEFERLAGKAASKKWKSSIRVDKVVPGPWGLSAWNGLSAACKSVKGRNAECCHLQPWLPVHESV